MKFVPCLSFANLLPLRASALIFPILSILFAAKTGGKIAKKARLELEAKTGRKVVTGENYLSPAKPAKKIT